MSTLTTQSLLARSREALTQQRMDEHVARIRHDADLAQKCQRALASFGITGGEAQGRFVVVEEIAFSLEGYGLIGIHLPCCGCGKLTQVRSFVSSLASVAEIVDAVAADQDLFCKRCESGGAPAPEPSLAEQLERVIESIVARALEARE